MHQKKDRDGQKFTAAERPALRIRAGELRKAGVSQQKIADMLDVSQATICEWLKRYRAEFPETPVQEKVAARIRQVMVCCNAFPRFQEAPDDEKLTMLASQDWHHRCFFGELAARVAEEMP